MTERRRTNSSIVAFSSLAHCRPQSRSSPTGCYHRGLGIHSQRRTFLFHRQSKYTHYLTDPEALQSRPAECRGLFAATSESGGTTHYIASAAGPQSQRVPRVLTQNRVHANAIVGHGVTQHRPEVVILCIKPERCICVTELGENLFHNDEVVPDTRSDRSWLKFITILNGVRGRIVIHLSWKCDASITTNNRQSISAKVFSQPRFQRRRMHLHFASVEIVG